MKIQAEQNRSGGFALMAMREECTARASSKREVKFAIFGDLKE